MKKFYPIVGCISVSEEDQEYNHPTMKPIARYYEASDIEHYWFDSKTS